VLSSYRALFDERRRLEAGTDEINSSRHRLAQVCVSLSLAVPIALLLLVSSPMLLLLLYTNYS
jgi:hypothetical protein